ncbi:hypothetical protein FHT02_003324 [Sphingomonas xinjiangensis]|uniref:Uncharacterized protein n=1 Tax=Sphingomonas xinjiangensis TaxID=643568 RepID=A0A840YL89_9SPHN|nr:hypothetical protein [Sphingomonas xinjiangensis]
MRSGNQLSALAHEQFARTTNHSRRLSVRALAYDYPHRGTLGRLVSPLGVGYVVNSTLSQIVELPLQREAIQRE